MNDGSTLITLGSTRIGKSSLLFDLVEAGPFVWVGPEPMNPDVKTLPWCTDSDEDLERFAGKIRDPAFTVMIRVRNKNPKIFEVLNVRNRTIVFDESTCLAKPVQTKDPFNLFVRMGPSRGQRILISTHRPLEDMDPVIYFDLARFIYQVGPLKRPKDLEALYTMADADNNMEFEDFKARVKKLERYDYQRKNFNTAVLVVAGGTDAPRPERNFHKTHLD